MAASLLLDANEVSVDEVKNTSRLYVRLQIITAGGTYNHTGDTVGSITVNGQSYSLSGKNVNYNTTTTLYEATHTVTHNTDGSKSVTVTAEFDPNTQGTSRMTVSRTITLPSIPRASTLAATDANIGAVSMVAVNRRSSGYTHSISYTFGSLTGYLKPDGTTSATEQRFSDTAIAFTLPESFYSQIPGDPSGVCTLKCTTYQGNTRIGQVQTAQFTATADMTLCAPTATLTVTEADANIAALTGGSKLVRYASTARCTLTATARNGATVKKCFIGGVEGTTRLLPGVEEDTFTFSVTDSRGYSCSGTVVVSMADYIPLTAKVTANRTDPTSGNASITVSGNYYAAQFGKTVNELQLECTVGDRAIALTPTFTEKGYTASADVTGLDYRKSHSVYLTVRDKVSTLTPTATIGKGVPVFDWGESDFNFNVPVKVPSPTADGHAVNRKYAQEKFFPKTGGTMTGTLNVASPMGVIGSSYPTYTLKKAGSEEDLACMTLDISNRRLYFRTYPADMDGKSTRYRETYRLPVPNAGLSENASYDILTSKTPVSVSRGGTGASDAITARSNLGIGCTKLLSGAGTASGHGKYKMYLVIGRPGQDASIMTMLIPAAEVTTEAVRYQIADDVDFVAFNLSCSGSTLTVQKAAGNGSITAVYGIN